MKRLRISKLHLKRSVFLSLVFVFAIVGAVVFTHSKASAPDVNQVANTAKANSKKSSIRFIATGDMLPHDTVNQAAKTSAGYNYLPLFGTLPTFESQADLSFCNQESPSANGFGVSGYPTFNAPDEFAKNLSTFGCNIINLANNHSNDKGQKGIDETRNLWDGLGAIAVAGTSRSQAEQNTISYFEKSGIKFAFLSYVKCSNNTNLTNYGLNILSKSLTDTQIAEAHKKSDMIIVGVHWCHENTSAQDADQDAWAQYFADKGVDIVIGTGPHWLQPVKRLKKAGGGDTINWFSLGNLLSSQEDVNGLIGGIAVMDIDIATKSVTQLSFMPTYMHYEWTAAQKSASDYLARNHLMLYPLDQAADPLSKSQNNTTVSAQTDRVTKLLNTYTSVKMLTSSNFSQ